MKKRFYSVNLASVYAFDNCILRNRPRDNVHVYIGNLYVEFTNLWFCSQMCLSWLHSTCSPWSVSVLKVSPLATEPTPSDLEAILFTTILWSLCKLEAKFDKLPKKINFFLKILSLHVFLVPLFNMSVWHKMTMLYLNIHLFRNNV